MRPGVRVWYVGAVDGGGVTSSNAEEAYLFDAIDGANAQIVHHAAQTHWTVPLPVQNGSYPLLDMGPCWIHPPGSRPSRWATTGWARRSRSSSAPPTPTRRSRTTLSRSLALFNLSSQRQIVKLTYMMPGFSTGNAYFDAETGLLLYRHALWGVTKMFFILAEINYDFDTDTAFPEDDGPHAGFKSFVSEQSLGNGWGVGGGSVVIHALARGSLRQDDRDAGDVGDQQRLRVQAGRRELLLLRRRAGREGDCRHAGAELPARPMDAVRRVTCGSGCPRTRASARPST